jgi:hypothetical protein
MVTHDNENIDTSIHWLYIAPRPYIHAASAKAVILLFYATSRFPDTGNSLCYTNIICAIVSNVIRVRGQIRTMRTRLKLIEANASQDGSCSQRPHQSILYFRYPICWKIINDTRLKANVRVDEDGDTENCVRQWVK